MESAKHRLASRLEGVSESATLKLNALVQALKARGVDVVNLTAGEPDFHVPEVANVAVRDALDAHKSKYTPVPGVLELREAVARKTNLQQPTATASTQWKAGDVVVTNGGKQALFNAFLALLNPGDEVIIPGPFWLSYPEMVKLAGGTPKILRATFEQGFKITPSQLRGALTARTRVVVLNSPSNPTGAMYSKAEFAALGEVLAQAPDVCVISDEIYDRIALSDVSFCSFLEAAPALRDRVITVNGMSKAAAMTGWRIGWSVAPQWITQAMSTIQGQSTSGINALAQWASLAALKLPEAEFAGQIETYRRRRDLALEILKKAGKLKVFVPQGAFYVFFGVGGYLRAGEDSVGFAERILEKAGVAVVAGAPFGEPEWLRLSFSTDDKQLSEGCRRIVSFLESC